MVDLDDTIIEVHGYQKQGASFGYSGVRGLNALIATASTVTSAPVILGQRLRQGKTGSPRGTARIVADTLATLRCTNVGSSVRPLVRADSAFYGHATIGTAIKAGADVSVTVRMDPAVKTTIATIPDDAWEIIEHTDAIRDEATGRWISKAEVAEVKYTAFRSRKLVERVEGRLVVRRIPDLNPNKVEQPTLFDTYRHHAFFTTTSKTTMGTVAADKTHRAHAIIEQVHADLKGGPLAHLPSGLFTANSAWLVLAVIAFNITRAAGLIADHAGRLARATTATIRRTLITIPARLARSARRIVMHLQEELAQLDAEDDDPRWNPPAPPAPPRDAAAAEPSAPSAERPAEHPVERPADGEDDTRGQHASERHRHRMVALCSSKPSPPYSSVRPRSDPGSSMSSARCGGAFLVAESVSGLSLTGLGGFAANISNGLALLVAVGLSTYLGRRRRAGR